MMKSKRPALSLNVASSRDEKIVGTESKRIVALTWRGREDRDMRAHGVPELHRHMAEPAEPHHRELVAFLQAEMLSGE